MSTKKEQLFNDIIQTLEFYRDSGDCSMKVLSQVNDLLSVGSKHALKRIEVEGRRWFQKTYGNTYHTVKILIDGELKFTLPMQYGYGDSYKDNAIDHLIKVGELPEHVKKEPSYYLRENFNIKFSVVDVDRKKEL